MQLTSLKLKPHVLIQPEGDLILFGYDQEVTGVNINHRQIAFQIPLNSLNFMDESPTCLNILSGELVSA
jgi:hypothetical protein